MIRPWDTGWQSQDIGSIYEMQGLFKQLLLDLSNVMSDVKNESSPDKFEPNERKVISCEKYIPRAQLIEPVRVGTASFWPFGGPSEMADPMNDWFEGRKHFLDIWEKVLPAGMEAMKSGEGRPGEPLVEKAIGSSEKGMTETQKYGFTEVPVRLPKTW